ncbi:hypothetical protein HHL17_26555 [Chitinophaga sp. G-6-1-13]|uniref:Uncharacterized protein n=1 Tax=Chitinophaga fulva TaxID=2728842 RepID=A0A848GRY9_9BACT|nr:hypothetical protein [Chitinophaga fulva]NML40787.1 hypothetical protein [Chitinophaga fulva]
MKKVSLLLSLVMVVFIGSFFMAKTVSRARIAHVIFTPDPLTPNRCRIPVYSKGLTPVPGGTFTAAAGFDLPCISVTTFEDPD